MIINIRGTSGTGKSHLVRQVMVAMNKAGDPIIPQHEANRRQPIGYVLIRPIGAPGRSILVVGHYETPCGGCDTINKMDRIYELVRKGVDRGYDVLFEGLLISAEVNRTQKLHDDDLELTVIALTEIPLQECLDSVNKRRWAKHPDKPGVNPKNTEAKWKQTRRSCARLEEAGIEVHRVNREDAWTLLQEKLKLSA